MTPDLDRLGGLAWTRRTRGALTRAERRRLLAAIVRAQVPYVAGRVRLATGRTPSAGPALDDIRPPDSRLARAAEDACREQPPAVVGHSYRTWAFGSALAGLDRTALDAEQFYVACLLHDHGITPTVAGEDFTLRSADRALRCADDAGVDGTAIADAITVHATAGITVERDGPLGFYVQAGAMLDLTGLRAQDVPPRFREEVARTHTREGAVREFVALIRAEARAVPEGRFAQLHRCGFTLLVRTAPR